MSATPPLPAVECPLLEGLGATRRDALFAASVTRHYTAGEVIFEAGAARPGLHFVEAGGAEVLAPARSGAVPVRVALLTPGQAFGELSTLTDGHAITTVRAAATPTRVRIVSAAGLASLEEAAETSNVLLKNVIRINQQRLSEVHVGYVRQIEQTIELLTLRNASARLLILVIILMCITILTNHWLKLRPGIDVYSPAFAWAALVTIVLPTMWMAWRERYPLDAMGLTTRDLGRDLAASAAIVAAMLALGTLGLTLAGYPLAERFRLDYIVTYGPTYALHSALQEFMGRGVLLGMMLRIFESGTWRQRQLSNLAVSMMFGLTHIHFGLATVALSMVFSLLLGTYYMVHRNLAGPVLIHTVLGLSAFMFGLI
jgi:CRP-like cAMP-binding protein